MLPSLSLRFLRSNDGWSVCVVYCLDSHFVTDVAKFMAGALQVGLKRLTVHVSFKRCNAET